MKRHSTPGGMSRGIFDRKSVRVVAGQLERYFPVWFDDFYDDVRRMPVSEGLIQDFREWSREHAAIVNEPEPRSADWQDRFFASYMVGRRLSVALANEVEETHDVWMLLPADRQSARGWAFVAPGADPEAL